MRPTAGDYDEALRRKRQAAGESSRAAKRGRGRERAESAPRTEVLITPAAAEKPTGEPVQDLPTERAPEPAQAGAEEGEITATTEAEVVVVDLEEDAAAPGELEAGRRVGANAPPAVVRPKAEKTPPAAEAEKAPQAVEAETRAPAARSAERGPEPRRKESEGRKKGPEGSSRPPTQRPHRPRIDGPQERPARPGPRLSTMGDASQAAVLLAQVPTPESTEEVRGLGLSATMDLVMVSAVQLVNGILGVRHVMAQNSEVHAKALDRMNKYKKESMEQAQSLARLHVESKAREEGLKDQIKESERRAGEAASRAGSLEAKLTLASNKVKVLHARVEEQGTRLQQLEEEVVSAKGEAGTAAAAAEKAAAEADSERAKAAAQAEEARIRAAEAESRIQQAVRRAEEAEARAQQAEAKAERAVEDYKSSPEFKQELVEGGLDAYEKGFDKCKAKVAQVLRIPDSDLDKVQLAEPEDEPEGTEGDEGGEGADEATS